MSVPDHIRRLVDRWLGHLFPGQPGIDLVDDEEFARWARDLEMTTLDLKTVMSRWPQNGDLLQIRLDRSGLGHLAADWRNARLMQDLERVCDLCSLRVRCERDLRKGTSDWWNSYCPNLPTIEALRGSEIDDRK